MVKQHNAFPLPVLKWHGNSRPMKSKSSLFKVFFFPKKDASLRVSFFTVFIYERFENKYAVRWRYIDTLLQVLWEVFGSRIAQRMCL